MSEKDSELLEQQRRRKKRVARMKTTIVMTIAIWMLVSLIAIVSLIVCVVKLNSKINKLDSKLEQISYEAATGDTEAPVVESETEEDAYANVITGIDTEDNMAVEGDEHLVYLTFDTTPSENTNLILDALRDNGVKATFFVSGDSSEESKVIYKRIVDEGHTLGMHSYSNQYSTIYDSTEAFESDLKQIADYLNEVTGVNSIYYRFPGGSSNEISNVNMAEFVKVLNNNGIKYFDWNVSAGDTSSDYTVEEIVDNVKTGVLQYKTSVVLLHDDKSKAVTAEAISSLIEQLVADNCQILPIEDDTYVVQYIKAESVE